MSEIKLNLGCGLDVGAGWVNIDNSPNARLGQFRSARVLLRALGVLSPEASRVKWPKGIHFIDVTKHLPFADGSVDAAYASMLLTEMPLSESKRLMGEVFRVLRPGGVFRVATTDMALYAREYVAALEIEPKQARSEDDLPSHRFLRRLRYGHISKATGIGRSIRMFRPRQGRAKWTFDESSLRFQLGALGFACQRREFCDSAIPGIAEVERRTGPDALYIEATKSPVVQ